MVDYSVAAKSLAEKRQQSRVEDIEKKAEKYQTSPERVAQEKAVDNKLREHEEMIYAGVAEIIQEKGAKLFENKSVQNIEEQVKEGLLKNGTLINQTYSSGEVVAKFKDGSSYFENTSTLYHAAVGVAQQSFLSEAEKLPEAQKNAEMQKFYSAGDGTKQALYSVRAVEKLEKGWQTRTKAVQHGDAITVFDPDNIKDGISQDMKHYDKQADGNYAEISHEQFLETARGKQSTPVELKFYNDEPGHFAVKTKDGPVHLNANSGKQYSKEQLGQLGTDKAFSAYKETNLQVTQSLAMTGRS